MPNIYITEPEVISVDEVKQRFPAPSTVIAGTPEFSGQDLTDIDTLLIRSATTVTNDIKQHVPNLKNIIRVGVGLDNVDLPYCKQAGIAVFNAPGANAEAVSEYVLGVTLLALRKMHLLNDNAVAAWDRFKFQGAGLAGRTVGIVGFGNIGKRLRRKMAAFDDMTFLVYDPFLNAEQVSAEGATLVELPELLRRSSIVSLHLPLVPETKYLIDSEQLALLPDNALLINAARGGIVHEQELLNVMKSKPLTYVADTVENEPHVNHELLAHQNVIVTPHIASLTHDADQAMLTVALDNFVQNKPARI